MSSLPVELAPAMRQDPWFGLSDVYRDHADAVFRYVRSILRTGAEAEDVGHEVFLKVYRLLRDGHPVPDSMRGWLLSIARTMALDHLRWRARHRADGLDLMKEHAAPREVVRTQWISEPEVQAVFALLPRRQQEVIVLRYVLDCTHPQSARILAVAEAAVRQTHRRAIQTMAAALAASDLASERRHSHPMRAQSPRRLALGGFTLLSRVHRQRWAMA